MMMVIMMKLAVIGMMQMMTMGIVIEMMLMIKMGKMRDLCQCQRCKCLRGLVWLD